MIVAVLVHAAGCGNGSQNSDTPWPASLVPSERLKPFLNSDVIRISDQNSESTPIILELQLFDELWQGLDDKRARRAASDRLYEVWNAEPPNVLWPELVGRKSRLLVDPGRIFATFDLPVCSDSTTAIGAYMRAWKTPTVQNLATYLELAYERSADLAPFPRFWVELKSAYGARISGSADVSLARALELLPQARDLGGLRLESHVWTEILRASFQAGDLDDALIAAVMADTLATLSVPPGGAMAGVLIIRQLRADVLAARRNTHEAFALYGRNVRDARQLGLVFLAGLNLNGAGALAEAIGDVEHSLELDHGALEFALGDADSLNVPRYLMNIARSHRLLGDLDSCLVYQEEAVRWVEAYPHPRNVSRLPQMLAEYYQQIGAYDIVESLLIEAAVLNEGLETADARGELHLELIRGWMEIGRSDLVYRSMEDIADLRSGIGDIHADRHVVADLNLLIGEFLTRTGEYVLAAESLDLAEVALESRPNPAKSWVLARNRGLLDRARGNPRGAERWFQECIRLGEVLGYPARVSTGQLLLGSARLDLGDYEGAREAFPSTDPEEFQGRHTTRILALLLTGESYLRQGNPVSALAYLEEARQVCRSWTPSDLVGRVELETGRAHSAVGDAGAAAGFYEQVAARIAGADFQADRTEELAYFNGDLRRDLVEAWLGLEGLDARSSLDFAMRLLPRWSAAEGELQAPQIIFFVGNELSGRWLVDDSGVTWERLPGSAQLTRQLTPVLADMRVPGSEIHEGDLASLSHMLLDGVEPAWLPNQLLHIVPDLELFKVPWAALKLSGSGASVVEHGPVVVLGRPAIERGVEQLPGEGGSGGSTQKSRAILIIASDSAGSSGLDRLRHAEQEAAEVAAAWTAGDVDLRQGPEAALALTRDSDLSSYAAIHVASHALVYTGRADETVLVLAGDGLDAPTASKIGELELAADLVFLSACETGDGGETRSIHAGLAHGFQAAGAKQVIAPTAVIDDAAAREFAVSFYSHWRPGMSVAESLRRAQLQQKNGDRGHPFFWAFYQVFGRKR